MARDWKCVGMIGLISFAIALQSMTSPAKVEALGIGGCGPGNPSAFTGLLGSRTDYVTGSQPDWYDATVPAGETHAVSIRGLSATGVGIELYSWTYDEVNGYACQIRGGTYWNLTSFDISFSDGVKYFIKISALGATPAAYVISGE